MTNKSQTLLVILMNIHIFYSFLVSRICILSLPSAPMVQLYIESAKCTYNAVVLNRSSLSPVHTLPFLLYYIDGSVYSPTWHCLQLLCCNGI